MKYQRVFFDFWWLAAVAKNWLVIVLTMAPAWHLNEVFVYLLAVFVIGTRPHALAVLQHDGTHYLVSRSFLPENTWLHWEHHQWPGIPLRHLKALALEPAMEGAGNVNSTGAPTTAGLA